jgi:light-regulated signal transduction histidine kinase (bacteriophytochrome)
MHASPPQTAHDLSLTLFGRTGHLYLTTGMLSIGIIVTLAVLLAVALVLAAFARRRAREAQSANRKLASEIAERVRAQDELNELNVDLERRVAERTQQLQEANNQLEAFSYSVAHDLKAPLHAISGFSRIVIEDYGPKLDEDLQRHLQSIASGAQRMETLIEDLLAFSRQGRKEMTPSDIEMGELAASVFEELRSAVPERKIELNLQPLRPARGDRAMIRQVLVNQLSNAMKFTQGKDNTCIEVGCSQNGSDHNIYYVKDNGAGFDMKYSGKLFGVFQRLHSGQEFEGTGVGLAIVQRVVQRHGGRVWAEGKVNVGTTFHFTLPAEGDHS